MKVRKNKRHFMGFAQSRCWRSARCWSTRQASVVGNFTITSLLELKVSKKGGNCLTIRWSVDHFSSIPSIPTIKKCLVYRESFSQWIVNVWCMNKNHFAAIYYRRFPLRGAFVNSWQKGWGVCTFSYGGGRKMIDCDHDTSRVANEMEIK